MYDGKQVVRVETQYKSKDLYNIGTEMKDRKGTGNYEETRTIYNTTYVAITEKNLYQEVKKKLKDRDVEYQHKDRTNMLNGIVFTSGNEFFESLGMKFIDSGRTYQTGDKKGKKIMIPSITSKEDIPKKVTDYFDSCMEFLEREVGKDNIVLAQVHFDEDTPHLQAYFLPIVNEVKRKCFVKDTSGNVIKEKTLTKDGKETLTPKLLRDNNGKIIYESVKGKFLNNDQYWKQRGGKNSFAKLQDSFNQFINEKGFKLDRGNVGARVERKTKLEWEIEEKQQELKSIKEEINYSNNELNSNKDTLKEIIDYKSTNDILNIKKGLIGYSSNDVEKITDYSKQLEKVNIINTNELNKNQNQINKLKKENNSLKDNGELLKRNEIIKNQASIIEEQNSTIESLEDKITSLKQKFMLEIDNLKKLINKLCKALDKLLHREPKQDLDDYDRLADSINYDYYRKHDSKDKDDLEMGR